MSVLKLKAKYVLLAIDSCLMVFFELLCPMDLFLFSNNIILLAYLHTNMGIHWRRLQTWSELRNFLNRNRIGQ